MPPRSMTKLCFHTWKLPECAGKIVMTKLPFNWMWLDAQLLFKIDPLSSLPWDSLSSPQKSILSIIWTCCINYIGSRIHCSLQLFSRSVFYQTWSDANKLAKRFNPKLASNSVPHESINNTSVFLTRKAISQTILLKAN